MISDFYTTQQLHNIDDAEAERLCESIREQMIKSVSETGGHLASSLGAVELSVAIERVFSTDRDRIVFDVGHQCYAYKMLTGREGQMNTLRKMGGISGFPKPSESIHDAFIAGHASNSVSVALGMAKARTLMKEDYQVVALIGDGALTGGLAYEGLSNVGGSGEHMLVILNDNGMSIMPNVGGIARYLERQHLKPQYLHLKEVYRRQTAKTRIGRAIYRWSHNVKRAVKGTIFPSSFFEDMGFAYLGPVDGHDIAQLTRILRYAVGMEGPVLVHVRTRKGKGYVPAEQNPDAFHGVSGFHIEDGTSLKSSGPDFSSVCGAAMCGLAEKDPRICAITAAMLPGTGLTRFAERFPERVFDVGIAEGHAAAMAGGIAKQGMIPVFAVYSTFLQRSYDMLLHDIALQGLHAVLCVDRAGLVGNDGETHQGIFDVAYLRTVPGMTIYAPASFAEMRSMLRRAVEDETGPVAVRYPRGGENGYSEDHSEAPAVILRNGSDITICIYGTMVGEALHAADILADGCISAEIVKLNRIAPLDCTAVTESLKKTGRLLVAEEVINRGCIGEEIAASAAVCGNSLKSVHLINLGDRFIPQGSVQQLRSTFGIDGEAIAKTAREACSLG